jgi:hypothetical protein
MSMPEPIDIAGRGPTRERVKDVVSQLAGYTLVAGIGAMAYGAVLYCWLSEQIEARRLAA